MHQHRRKLQCLPLKPTFPREENQRSLTQMCAADDYLDSASRSFLWRQIPCKERERIVFTMGGNPSCFFFEVGKVHKGIRAINQVIESLHIIKITCFEIRRFAKTLNTRRNGFLRKIDPIQACIGINLGEMLQGTFKRTTRIQDRETFRRLIFYYFGEFLVKKGVPASARRFFSSLHLWRNNFSTNFGLHEFFIPF